MKKTLRTLSMALAILLIAQLLPAASLAAKADELRALARADAAQAALAPIAYEEVEKRDANTKVFRRADGAHTAVISPQPVHYREAGEWKEIDNTLERKTENGRTVLQNRQNAFHVTLPEAISEGEPVSITKDGHTLSFAMQGVAGSASAAVKQQSRAEKKAAQAAPEAVRAAKLERQSAALVYEDVRPDTDVEYTVLPQSLKENIILQKAPGSAVSYRFRIQAEGLSAALREDNSIAFADASGEAVFLLPAPFLYDAAQAVSTDVAVSLSGRNGDYTLTYTPSAQWLAEKSRVYPVVLDPVVETNVASGIEDSYVLASGLGAVIPHHLLATALVEKDAANTYIKFLNSNIWSSKTSILGATLTMYGANQAAGDTVITAHKVTESWMDKHLIRPTEPAAEAAALDYAVASSAQPAPLSWDITKAVAEWQASSSLNFGIRLQVSGERAGGKAELYTSEHTNAQYRPVFQIEYRETSGKPAQYEYHTQSVGRAGEVSVNDATRGLYIARDELGIDGNLMPVSIRRYFSDANANSLELMVGSAFSPYGNRWLTNYNRLIAYRSNDADGVARYRYLDETGTVLYYVASGEPAENGKMKWVEECPLGVGDTGSALWLPENLADRSDYTRLELETAQGHKLAFDARGRLVTITDDTPNANQITIAYDGDSLIKISKIVDGAGREYRFVYDTAQASQGLLSTIECYAADGTAITVTDETGAELPLKMTYTYSKSLLLYRLASAVYPDGETVTYEYNALALPSAVSNIDGYRMEYEYDGAGRVSKMTEKAKDPDTGAYVTGNVVTVTSQGIYQTTFADNWGNLEVKRFDRYGRTESARDADGLLTRQEYETEEIDGVTLSIAGASSDLFHAFDQSNNRLANGGFTEQKDGLPTQWTAAGLGSADGLHSVSVNGKPLNALELFGGTAADKRLSQTVTIDAQAGDILTLGGWAKADAAVAREETRFSIRAAYTETFVKEDGTVGTRAKVVDVPFDPYVADWQCNARVIELEGACTEVAVSIEFAGQVNKAQFAAINLLVEQYHFEEMPDEPCCVCGEDCPFGPGCDCRCESRESCTCEQCHKCLCPDCQEPDCACRCADEASCDCPQCKRGRHITTDNNGNQTQTRITSTVKSMVSQQTYTADGNYISGETDADGNTVFYTYRKGTNQLSSATDGNGNTETYAYDPIGQLRSVTQMVSGLTNGEKIENRYQYSNDRLASITHNGTTYTFVYDIWGNQTSVKAGTQTLASYEYGSKSNRTRVGTITFGNGQTITYRHDDANNVTGISHDGGATWRYTYVYEDDGLLLQTQDHLAGTTVCQDEAGYTVMRTSDDTILYRKTHADDGSSLETIHGVSYLHTNADTHYDALTGQTQSGSRIQGAGTNIGFAGITDYFGRTIQKKAAFQSEPGMDLFRIGSEYTYKNYADGRTGNQVHTYRVHISGANETLIGGYRYEYDGNGNITAIYDADTNQLLNRYQYDAANQLIRADSRSRRESRIYTYDQGGNLVSEARYVFSTGDVSGTPYVTTYTYDNMSWKDQLTGINGKEFTYDENGNPLTYNGWVYTWRAGRQLASLWHPNLGAKFVYQYNADGLRTQKRVYNTDDEGVIVNPNQYGTWDYIWADGKILSQTVSYTGIEGAPAPQTMRFLYDEQSELRGFTLGGETYLYAKNLQGDIIAIVNEEGNVEVQYQYGPWGQMEGNNAVTGNQELAELNPFTYRGYQYDRETGLYYLQSRYYNPDWRRFLNADSVELVVSFLDQIRATNLYSYCYNAPIQNEDPSGYGITKPKKHPFSQKNRYSANKSLTNQINKYEKHRLTGYINGQGRAPYSYYQMGAFYADYNGCGWISVHNVLVRLGRKKWPHDVINDLESISSSKYIGSVFGIGPLAITKYLKKLKIKYNAWGPLEPQLYWSYAGAKTFLNVPNVEKNVKKSKISILLFSTGSSMHYVAVTWDGRKQRFVVYNRFNNTDVKYYPNLSGMRAGASKFIVTHITIPY